MAIILKDSKSYSPRDNTGLDLSGSDYYGVVDSVEYDKKLKSCSFSVDIYASKSARDTDKSVVDRVIYTFNNDDFDNEIGSNGYTVSQAYTKALANLADWEGDE